jgi:lycopene cyclase domain-containing protein
VRTEYFIVLFLVLVFPLILSFDRKLAIYRHARALFGAIAAVSVPFWVWDVLVTARGHWSFNPAYTVGVGILGLPIEEWLFFPVVSFVSIFTWESAKYFRKEKE